MGFVDAMTQMDVDANYVYQKAQEWAKENDPKHGDVRAIDWNSGEMPIAHHALMAVIGLGQIRGDRALGLQASSLSPLDPRTPAGCRQNLAISTSSAASLTGTATTAAATAAALPPGWPQIVAAGTGAVVFGVVNVTQARMILQRLWANRFGRSNSNPELNERFRNLQTRILAGIRNAGIANAGDDIVLGVLGNGNIFLGAGNVVLDLGVAYLANQAKRIEESRVRLRGAQDPEPSAKAIERVLGALGGDAGAGIAANMNPAELGHWWNAINESIDAIGHASSVAGKELLHWIEALERLVRERGW